jgi:hypothetical protein
LQMIAPCVKSGLVNPSGRERRLHTTSGWIRSPPVWGYRARTSSSKYPSCPLNP